jgi:hypothetical protein
MNVVVQLGGLSDTNTKLYQNGKRNKRLTQPVHMNGEILLRRIRPHKSTSIWEVYENEVIFLAEIVQMVTVSSRQPV